MAFFLRLALWASLVFMSTSELVINVQPSVISPITPQLVINCSITNNQVQNLEVIKSLTLSRYNETRREFEDLFRLNSSTLNLKQLHQLQFSQISFGNMYITLTLQNPTQFDANAYKCNVTGDNAEGTNISLFAKKTVEYETNSNALIEEIRRYKKNEKFQCSLKKDDHSEFNQKSRLRFYGSSEIITELIEPLTLKCLYKTLSQDQSETSSLQSLFILHETIGVIAYINKQQPVITRIQGGNLKNVEGEIYDKELKDSYLQVTWNNLKHSESGNYFCEAHVNSSDGGFDKMNEMLTISVLSPRLEDLVKVIQKLQRQADVDKEIVRENQHKIKSIKNDLDTNIQNVITIKEDSDTMQQDIMSLKEYMTTTKQDIMSLKEDVNTSKLDIMSLNEDMNTSKQDILSIKEILDTKHQNIVIIQENIDKNKHNMFIFKENLTMTVANFSAALKEVENQMHDVNKLLPYYFVPPTSCRYIDSIKARVDMTLASGLKVMCDTKTDGGGWIIFQRRINGKVDFYRGWKEYRDGFGDYNIGEFYLGNENIFKLTSTGQYDLRIDLEYNNKTYFAQYKDFKLLSETKKYKLQIGTYSGDAGDGLIHHNNMFFSTYDRDNDKSGWNCAQKIAGAWWYKDCHWSNLNGNWGSTSSNKGLNWFGLTGYENSVSFSEMKLREIK